MNHPRAFTHTGEAHLSAADIDPCMSDLGSRIGGNDGAGEFREVRCIGRQRLLNFRERVDQLFHGQGNADDAG